MNEEITVEDLGQLVKVALSGDKKQRDSATRLLSLLPAFFHHAVEPEWPTKKKVKP